MNDLHQNVSHINWSSTAIATRGYRGLVIVLLLHRIDWHIISPRSGILYPEDADLGTRK
jgi:hypothetical protein